MSTARSPEKRDEMPFEDDLSYLLAELGWVRARSQRLGAERDAAGDPPTARSSRRYQPMAGLLRARRPREVRLPDGRDRDAAGLERRRYRDGYEGAGQLNAILDNLAIVVQNRTAWPARVTDDLALRVFVDLTEVFAAGYALADVTVSTAFSQASAVSALRPFDAARSLYYVEVSFDGVPIAPSGESDSRREVQLRLSLPTDSADPEWDPANDWSFAGLDGEPRETDRIPVYEDGVLAAGAEPAAGR